MKSLSAFFAALLTSSTAAAVPEQNGTEAKSKSEADRDYEAMTAPGLAFIQSIATKFPERECIRDRSLLEDKFDVIQKSLMQFFIVRGDLRKDIREVFMRLATFHELSPEKGLTKIALVVPPQTEAQKQLNGVVVRLRTAFWTRLDELEAQFPAGEDEKNSTRPGLLLTTDDRGIRPDHPDLFVHEPSSCRVADA